MLGCFQIIHRAQKNERSEGKKKRVKRGIFEGKTDKERGLEK
jgi:hypothetical protein